VQLGPDTRTGAKRQQAYCLAAMTQGHHEQSCASILAALGVAHHGAAAIVELRLLACGGDDYGARFEGLGSA
jgi:hypothetical protein